MLLPKLMSINCANFDFPACNFTERNMYLKDRHTGAGREGSGRVSAYKATGLVQSYTLECNFNTGRLVNCVPMASRDSGRASPPAHQMLNNERSTESTNSIPKYNPEIYEDSGKQLAISILDMTESNPWTRLTCSAYKNLKGVKEWVRKYIKHSEEQQQRNNTKTSPEKMGSPVQSSTRRSRTFSSSSKKKKGQPGSPGSYRPVSKIARKNSLNQQQSPPSHMLKLQLENTTSRRKLNRSKSLVNASPRKAKSKSRSSSASFLRAKSPPVDSSSKQKKAPRSKKSSDESTTDDSKKVRSKPIRKKSKVIDVNQQIMSLNPLSPSSSNGQQPKKPRPKRKKSAPT